MKKIEINGTPISLYAAIHYWLKHKFGVADRCENKSCKDVGKRFEWALKKGKNYEYKRRNFIKLCSKCHRKYDPITEEGKDRLAKSRMGRKHSEEVRKKISVALLGHPSYNFPKKAKKVCTCGNTFQPPTDETTYCSMSCAARGRELAKRIARRSH